MALPAGTRLGRYEVRSQLGAGGMGEVYLAWDSELERQVALKVLPSDVTADRQRMSRFIQEAKAASALNHPNILSIHDAGGDDSARFIVMEYVEGETLRQRMAGGRIDLREALDVGAQVASAIAEAHAAGIVHRDIKPENVMLRRGGIVKVLDFGIAKLTERRPLTADTEAPTRALVNTGPGAVMGTVAYMSPEQARGLEVDARTDIWSLGVVLYEMVSGRVPFEGQTATDILALILHREPQPLRLGREGVPPELERIVEKALTKDREERYQTAKDLALDLRRLRQRLDVEAEIERSATPDRGGEGRLAAAAGGGHAAATVRLAAAETDGGVQTTSSAEYVVSEIRRHKRGALLALAALLVITIAVGYFAYSRYSAGGSKGVGSVAVLPFENASGDPDMEYLSDGITESLINSLTQLPGVRVLARSTMFRFKGKDADPLAVGKQLGVDTVLTGRVVQVGDSLSVQADLINVSDGSQLWGESYSRRPSDLVALQREMARDVSNKLRVKLSGADEQKLAKSDTGNAEAYQLYLKGRFHWNRRTRKDIEKALEYFQQAIAIDPNYALAYVGVAEVYMTQQIFPTQTHERMSKARESAQKALSLDDSSAEAHTALGRVLSGYDYDLAAAEREYRRAVGLNPTYANAHYWSGQLFMAQGRWDEAFAEYRRALELEPLSLIINASYGGLLKNARRYDEAVAHLKKTLELDENFIATYGQLAQAYWLKGNYAESVEALARTREINGEHEVASRMRESFAKGGWEGYLRYMTEDSQVTRLSFALATYHAALGEKDRAFAALNKSYESREAALQSLKVDPRLDPLRSDPRFAELMRRVSLPQ